MKCLDVLNHMWCRKASHTVRDREDQRQQNDQSLEASERRHFHRYPDSKDIYTTLFQQVSMLKLIL